MVNKQKRALGENSSENGQPANRDLRSRLRMAGKWAATLDLLETRTKNGKNLVEIWADLTLDNPAEMFAFVNEHVLSKEPIDQPNQQLTSIQNLYLTAIQQASRMPAPALDVTPALPDDDSEW